MLFLHFLFPPDQTCKIGDTVFFAYLSKKGHSPAREHAGGFIAILFRHFTGATLL